jgi:hypothetical protein
VLASWISTSCPPGPRPRVRPSAGARASGGAHDRTRELPGAAGDAPPDSASGDRRLMMLVVVVVLLVIGFDVLRLTGVIGASTH